MFGENNSNNSISIIGAPMISLEINLIPESVELEVKPPYTLTSDAMISNGLSLIVLLIFSNSFVCL